MTPWVISGMMLVLTLAFVLAFVRVVRGPSLPDRVVALDLMGALAVGFMIVTAVAIESSWLMKPALVVAFVAFLGTVAFARYIEKTGAQMGER
jgi:multicomponent Na+:H+ antiporter subunit F